MIVTAYMRVARTHGGRAKVSSATRPTSEPLKDNSGGALPTVSFALKLDIPDSLIDRAEEVIATLTIPEEAAQIAADVEMA